MNLSFAELLIIVVFALLIVGPDKLPKAGKTIGKALRQFRDAQGKVNDTLKKEGLDPKSVQEMAQNPFLALEQLERLDTSAGNGEAVPAASGEPAGELPAQALEEAAGSKPVATHKVVRLTERESFTERKVRLARERELVQEAAEESPEAPQAADDGEGGTGLR